MPGHSPLILANSIAIELPWRLFSKRLSGSPQRCTQTIQKIGPPLDSSGRADVCAVACQHEGQTRTGQPAAGVASVAIVISLVLTLQKVVRRPSEVQSPCWPWSGDISNAGNVCRRGSEC